MSHDAMSIEDCSCDECTCELPTKGPDVTATKLEVPSNARLMHEALEQIVRMVECYSDSYRREYRRLPGDAPVCASGPVAIGGALHGILLNVTYALRANGWNDSSDWLLAEIREAARVAGVLDADGNLGAW